MNLNGNQWKQILLAGWIATLVIIPILSICGRPLQHWVADSIGYTFVAWGIGLALLLCFLSAATHLKHRKLSIPYVHLFWFAVVFLVLPLFLERVEERLHFLTFGLFGAFSMLLFKPRYALMMCILFSGADELLQFFLADRFGDWRDVGMNCLASLAAGMFVWFTMIKPATTEPVINKS